jgi:predicted GNAT family acetyltransferase
MSLDIFHNVEQHRFETTVEGQLCVIDYRYQGRTVHLTHVGVPRPVGNRGIAAALTQFALDWARAEGLQVAPDCPYVLAWIRRHREYQILVRRPL